MADTYYPYVSDLVTFDQLPDGLTFISDDLHAIFSKIRYQNFIAERSINESTGFYQLNIVVFSALKLDVGGTGLVLILNPDLQSGAVAQSIIPINLNWRWDLLRYVLGFNISQFASDATAYFNLLMNFFTGSDKDFANSSLIDLIKGDFSDGDTDSDGDGNYDYYPDPSADADQPDLPPLADDSIEFDPDIFYQDSPLIANYYTNQFAADILAKYPETNIPQPLDDDPDTAYNQIVIALSASGMDVKSTILDIYLIDPNSLSNSLNNIDNLLSNTFNGDALKIAKQLIVPELNITSQFSAGLEIPRSILIPVDNNNVVIPGEIKTTLVFDIGNFFFNTKTGFGFQDQLSLSFSPATPKAEIGTTGLIIGFTNAILYTTPASNNPTVDAAGYSDDFVGLFVQQATISINNFGTDDPDHISASITATNFLIGTGGVSGAIAMQEQGGLIHRKFGSFSVELDAFSLTFRQNAITACSITGAITLDKYTTNDQPSKISIRAQIKDSGDFSITATPSANFPSITLPGVFTLDIRQLVVGEEQPKGYYVQIAGTLSFVAALPVLGDVLPKNINISKLRIWDDGSIDFVGGKITLPVAFTLKIGPVNLEVKSLSIGSYSRKLNGVDRSYCYFSFDGMVNTGNAGVEVGGNGIKYYFTVDDGPDKPHDHFIRIDQIDIDITIPGNVDPDDADFILRGYLSVSTPNPNVQSSTAGSEYAGFVSVSIPKIGLTGSAGMRLNPSVPSFVVDLGLEVATPIPLGGTGLAIYGFRGLIGEHYLPSKSATSPPLPDTATWWDYYKAKNIPDGLEGIEIDKFADEPGFSLGAGIEIATDGGGYIFSAKLFLLLGIPDVILIQGQAGILQDRIGLNDTTDPPFSALIAIDRTSFTGDLSVNYNLPSSGSFRGDIFSLKGSLDLAFYFNNASGWYLDLGKDTPTSARIQANILTLFKGYAYVMISAQGFKAGAGASFDFTKSFGPVGVSIGAYLDLGAFISFSPIQIGGFIQFGGYAYLKLAFFKIGLSVQVSLAVEAPHPFNITGGLQVKVKTPWPLPNINFSLTISWHFNNDNSELLAPVQILALPDATTGYSPAIATNMMSQETFPVNYVNQIYSGSYTIPAPGAAGWEYDFTDTTAVMKVTVPLDSYIDIELLKPVLPGNVPLGGAGSQIPDGYTELLPPVKGISAQVKHSYSITGLDIFVWDNNGSSGGSWVPYQVYEAVTAIVDGNTGTPPVDLSGLPQGYWQFVQPNTYNKIRLLSQTMFSYSNGSDSSASNLDNSNFQRKALFCYEVISEENVVNWKGETTGTVYAEGSTVLISGVSFNFAGLSGTVSNDAGFGGNNLFIQSLNGSVLVTLPEQVTQYEIDFGPNQNDLLIYPITTTYSAAPFGQTMPVDTKLSPSHLSATQQNTSITYNDPATPVDKILIIIDTTQPVDFGGDLNIGGYFQLPDQFLPVTSPQFHHEYDQVKALMYVSLYNTSLSAADILGKQYNDTTNVVGQWPLNSGQASVGSLNGNVSGDPDLAPGYYPLDNTAIMQLQQVFSYSENSDALIVPFNDALKVETGSFSFEVTALFDAYTPGISTLLSKVSTDPVTGNKKGYALHLYKQTAGDPLKTYTDMSTVPGFTIWLTCYDGQNVSGIQATELYTLDYSTSKLAATQYKHIIVTVDRDASSLSIYIDRVLKTSVAIPAELALVNIQPFATYIDQLNYLTTSVQARQQESNVTPDTVINEVQILSDNLNKVIQPVWRPNTTFAIAVTTKDTVNGNTGGAIAYTQVFGFQTAGPVGLFQQQSAVYQALVQADQADMFKLADLTSYIDYNRSSPDAQGRFNMSKPVLYHNPQISLIFTQPYINAMYSDWDSYQGLPAVQSTLQIQLIDPYGNALSPQLVWSQLPDQTIDGTNYKSLPNDQQLIFLLDQAASQDSCNPSPVILTRKIKQGAYQFPDLAPNKLYTAVFNAVYQPSGKDQQASEVHKYGFMSSRFATFQDQASSFILDDTLGAERYALYPLSLGFTSDQVTQDLLPLLNNDSDNTSPLVMQYPVQFDRIIFGGCQLKAFEPSSTTIINLLINTDPDNENKQLLGIIIRNPEPFNDPNLPVAELANTFQLTLTQSGGTVIPATAFEYIYSADTSAVLITNSNLLVAAGTAVFTCTYKIFNGTDYDTVHEDYTSPSLTIAIS